jgi:hypothetical protein
MAAPIRNNSKNHQQVTPTIQNQIPRMADPKDGTHVVVAFVTVYLSPNTLQKRVQINAGLFWLARIARHCEALRGIHFFH